jgi:hypothetical protein
MFRLSLLCLAWLGCARLSAEEKVTPPKSWAPLFARVVRADRAAGRVTVRYLDAVASATVRIEVVRRKGYTDEEAYLPKRQTLQESLAWKVFEVKLRAKDFRLRTVGGKEVRGDGVWEHLRPGAVLLYAKKGKLDPVYLPAFRPDLPVLTARREPARAAVSQDKVFPEDPPPSLRLFKAAEPERPMLETVEALPEDVRHSIKGGNPDRGIPGKVVATPLKEPLISDPSRSYFPDRYRLVVTDGAGRPVKDPWRKLKRGQLIVVPGFDGLSPFYRQFLHKDVFVVTPRRP